MNSGPEEFRTVEPGGRPIGPDAGGGRLGTAVIAAVAAGALSAAIWAAISIVTGYQIGLVAIGIGIFVGIAVRRFGQGETAAFRLVAAAVSLLACITGNVIIACVFFARQIEAPVLQVVESLDADLLIELLTATFEPMDLLFYALAVWQGWKLAVADEEIEEPAE
jgi:hypothetical protein